MRERLGVAGSLFTDVRGLLQADVASWNRSFFRLMDETVAALRPLDQFLGISDRTWTEVAGIPEQARDAICAHGIPLLMVTPGCAAPEFPLTKLNAELFAKWSGLSAGLALWVRGNNVQYGARMIQCVGARCECERRFDAAEVGSLFNARHGVMSYARSRLSDLEWSRLARSASHGNDDDLSLKLQRLRNSLMMDKTSCPAGCD